MPKSTALLVSAAIVSTLLLAACSPQAPDKSAPAGTESAQMTPAPTQKVEVPQNGKAVSKEMTYLSPAGEEKVGFTVVVDDKGVITDAKTQVFGIKHESVERQQAFANGVGEVVIGKKLADLGPIDRVGGASLTTNAFNDALSDLKAQL